MHRLVLVIDMQNGFVDPKGTLYIGDAGPKIVPRIRKVIEAELASGSTVMFTADTHDPDDLEFTMWPPHCIKGSWEAEIIPELRAAAPDAPIVPKHRYSACYDTNLVETLEQLRPDEIIVMGVCTDICVMHTVTDLRNRDYNVTVLKDAVASFDEQAHQFALQHMEKILGARISSTEAHFAEAPHAELQQ